MLTNRAIQGQYNLGSAFKPFTAYSALATGLLGPDVTYNDTGTYKLVSIPDDRCAEGVRCEYRNAICSFNNRPCVYGSINTQLALAVSSDAFFYKLGEEFYLAPGTQLQDQVRKFGFGAETGIDLPYEFDGRIPTNELKQRLLEAGVLDPSETPNLQPGDLIQMSVGQGLLAATPLQVAVGYAAIANGGNVLTPRVVKAVYEPGVPDGQPGYAALRNGTVARTVKPKQREDPDDRRDARADHRRAAPEHHGPRRQRPEHHGRGAVPGRVPGERDPDRRQDRDGPGRQQLSVERLLGVRRRQPGRAAAVHRRVLSREVRLRLTRRGAGGEVHVSRPVGHHAARPGARLRAARPRQLRTGAVRARPSTRRAWPPPARPKSRPVD